MVSVSAIGTGAPFSVNAVRKVVADGAVGVVGIEIQHRSAVVRPASTSMNAFAVLLLLAPSLTTMSMTRVAVEGVVPVLSNVICCSAV